ncbi:hypothetical protein SCUP234_10747 [Seiridium cupressi]
MPDESCCSGMLRRTAVSRPQHPHSSSGYMITARPGTTDDAHRDEIQHLVDAYSLTSSIPSTESDRERMLNALQARLNLTFAEIQSTSIKNLAGYTTFFTCAAYSMFIPAVWNYRQWQWCTIHWPTIRLDEVAHPLLVTLGLGGAGLVSHRGKMDNICTLDNEFYEIVETYVFDCLETAMTFHDDGQLDARFIETCQAALLIIAVENGINDSATKRRLLTRRFPSLVAAMRILSTEAQSHRGSSHTSWKDFVRRESCIRTITWTFLQDALFTVLYCHPPSMAVAEMTCDLPCNELLWAAESVYSALFSIRSSAPVWTWSTMFLGALSRWSMFWDAAFKRMEQRRYAGMDHIKHAPEFAALLRRIVDIEANGQTGALSYFQGTIHYDFHPVHELIRCVSE